MATEEQTEICPEAQLEELRDASRASSDLEQQAAAIRGHAWLRVSKKLGLSAEDSINLQTGVITRRDKQG